jgi:flagellar hook-length control protein FliK
LYLPLIKAEPAVRKRPPPEPVSGSFERELESRINQGLDRDDRRQRLTDARDASRPSDPVESRRSADPPESRSVDDRSDRERVDAADTAPSREGIPALEGARKDSRTSSAATPEPRRDATTDGDAQDPAVAGDDAEAGDTASATAQGDAANALAANELFVPPGLIPAADAAQVSPRPVTGDAGSQSSQAAAQTQPVAPGSASKPVPAPTGAPATVSPTGTDASSTPVTGPADPSRDPGEGQTRRDDALFTQPYDSQRGSSSAATPDRSDVAPGLPEQATPARKEVLPNVSPRNEASAAADSKAQRAEPAATVEPRTRDASSTSNENVAARIAGFVAPEAHGSAKSGAAESSSPVTAQPALAEVATTNATMAFVETATSPAPSRSAVSSGATAAVSTTDTTATARLDEITGQAKVEDIARVVGVNMGSRNSHVRLTLNPPQLGEMRIDVQLRQDVMSLRIQVETEAAFARIGSTAGQLKHALEQHGVAVEHFDVQLRGFHSSASRSEPHSGHHGHTGQDARFTDGQQTFDHDRSQTQSARDETRHRSDGPAGEPARDIAEDVEFAEAAWVESVLTATAVDLVA